MGGFVLAASAAANGVKPRSNGTNMHLGRSWCCRCWGWEGGVQSLAGLDSG